MSEYNYISRSFTYEGKRYYVKGKTEREVQRKIGEKLSELKSGNLGVSSNMTVKAWAETWLKTYRDPKIRPEGKDKRRGTVTKKSAGMYHEKINNYIIPALGNLKIKDVKDTHLQVFLNENSHMSFSHVSKLRMILKALFKQAYLSRIISYDPSVGLELPAAEKGSRRSLTDYERKVLLKIAEDSDDGVWIKFLLYTGIRPGESAALKVKHLDFKENLIQVSEAVESGSKVVSMPKTAAGIRYVFIPEHFVPELQSHVINKSPEEFVFTQRDGKSMMTQTVIRKYWNSFTRLMDIEMGAEMTSHGHIYDPNDLLPNGKPKYPEEHDKNIPRNGHKIAPDLVMYCLRHTYCTDLQRSGVPLETARYLMGHEDISTTANIYTHSDKTDALRAAKLVSQNKERGKSVETKNIKTEGN